MALEVGVRQKQGDWKEALLLLTPKLDGKHIYKLGDKKVRLQNLHKPLFTYLYLDALSNKLQSRN